VRLTTLLDQLNGSTPGSHAIRSISGTSLTDAEQFDQLVATLIPCREHDAELWFAEAEAEVEAAKALCRECPIREGCLAGALSRQEPWGVWGGEVFIGGVAVPRKRGRGRPRKDESSAA
jgi:WhiB family redox-sensing transcriptional regulator